MKRTKPITKKLYIEELERPVLAKGSCPNCPDGKGSVTTLAVGEEACKPGLD